MAEILFCFGLNTGKSVSVCLSLNKPKKVYSGPYKSEEDQMRLFETEFWIIDVGALFKSIRVQEGLFGTEQVYPSLNGTGQDCSSLNKTKKDGDIFQVCLGPWKSMQDGTGLFRYE